MEKIRKFVHILEIELIPVESNGKNLLKNNSKMKNTKYRVGLSNISKY